MRRVVRAAAALIVVAGTCVVGVGAAEAAPPVTLGGGAGILIPHTARTYSICTLASIGHDNTGALVGLTAGHCGTPGQTVVAEHSPRTGPIGRFITSVAPRDATRLDVLDYAVIRFDPSRVRPTRSYRGTTIVGVSNAVRRGQVACKRGRSSGYDCGVVIGRTSPVSALAQTCSTPGDSGGPVVVGTRLVGVVRGYQYFTNIAGTGIPFNVACTIPASPIHNPMQFVLYGAITHDLATHQRPGAGFRPL